MLPRTKILLLLLLLLAVLLSSFSGSYGKKESAENDISLHLKVMHQATRKLLGGGGGGRIDVLDYHDPGPNSSHDPGKGKGGPGGPH